MAADQHKNSHRNGGRPQVLPTSERHANVSKPHNIRSSFANTPEPILYFLTFFLLVFGITFLIIGGVYINQCHLQPMLPVWLLVMGLILAIGGGWQGFFVLRMKKEPFRRVGVAEKVVTAILLILYFGWFIVGNVYVYQAWAVSPDYGHHWFENGCNKSVFILSFIVIITMDAFVGILFIAACFWGVSKVVVRE